MRGTGLGLSAGLTKIVTVAAASPIIRAVPKNGARHDIDPSVPPTNGPKAIPAPSAADRKSTRLNSSHVSISYAVFCLKKKNKHPTVYACRIQHYHST